MQNDTQSLCILGSTGSVGQSTLDVVSLHPEHFSIYGLTANHNVPKMLQQCQQFNPQVVVMADGQSAKTLSNELSSVGLHAIDVYAGNQAISEVASHADVDSVLPGLCAVAAGYADRFDLRLTRQHVGETHT